MATLTDKLLTVEGHSFIYLTNRHLLRSKLTNLISFIVSLEVHCGNLMNITCALNPRSVHEKK